MNLLENVYSSMVCSCKPEPFLTAQLHECQYSQLHVVYVDNDQTVWLFQRKAVLQGTPVCRQQ